MRYIAALFIILVMIFALGCSKEVVVPAESKPVPQMGQVQPDAGETVTAPEKAAETKTEETGTETKDVSGGSVENIETDSSVEKELSTLGSRVTGTKEEANKGAVPENKTEVMLFANKTMSMTSLTVSSGTAVYYKNYDSWPHQLAIETGKSFDTKRHALSTRILEGEVWEYTFNDKGTFLVRDIFSGPMRMNVTVE